MLNDEPRIKEKASKLSLRLKTENFARCDGWLNCFKARSSISVQKLLGESAGVSESAIHDWYPVLAKILKNYMLRDVYNALHCSRIFYRTRL
jgi:hypothetical protein